MITIQDNTDEALQEMYRLIDYDSNTYEIEGTDKRDTNQYFMSSFWDVHEFVSKVILSNQLAFEVSRETGRPKIVKELPLSRYINIANGFIRSLPKGIDPYGYVGIFYECCDDLNLFYEQFRNPGAIHSDNKLSAEAFNDLILLIREKAKSPKHKKLTRTLANRVNRNFKSMKDYIDSLFNQHAKLLVLRVDFGYLHEVAKLKRCEDALEDFSRFLNNRRGNALFEHQVGYIRSLEYGPEGKGWHIHCIFFFNGNKVENDVELAHLVCEYWKVNINDNDGAAYNCNKSKNFYRYCGIGMVHYSDELMRTHLLYALTYLTKKEGLIGFDIPDCKMITRGNPPKKLTNKPGPKRKVVINR